jgi:hypothetical protein
MGEMKMQFVKVFAVKLLVFILGIVFLVCEQSFAKTNDTRCQAAKALGGIKPMDVDIPKEIMDALSQRWVTPPNDSCSIALKFGSDFYFQCDQGYFKSESVNKYVKVQEKTWKQGVAKIVQALSEHLNCVDCMKQNENANSEKVIGDSCAVGAKLGSQELLICDSGVVVSDPKGKLEFRMAKKADFDRFIKDLK